MYEYIQVHMIHTIEGTRASVDCAYIGCGILRKIPDAIANSVSMMYVQVPSSLQIHSRDKI